MLLTKFSQKKYEFRYDDNWFANESLPAISLTIPKSKQVYKSEFLFPFFFNMLSEGVNRQLQTRHLKIGEKDYFGLLLANQLRTKEYCQEREYENLNCPNWLLIFD